jgi:hypothetical protein
MRSRFIGFVVLSALASLGALAACGSDRDGFGVDGNDAGFEGSLLPTEGGFGDVDPGLPPGQTRDPIDCNEAKESHSYVGCDYWPTVTANPVWSIFDFAVVVANTGSNNADITVTGPNGVNKTASVPAGELRKIYLPWVPELKGLDLDSCANGSASTYVNSVIVPNGAYHLVSSVPVIVYQFNALEYEGAGGEAPGGGAKDWSSCPGLSNCPGPGGPVGCFSFSNDASLLLPSTAMTPNYRVVGIYGWSTGFFPIETHIQGPLLTVTATEANTQITFTLPSWAPVVASAPDAGASIPTTNGGGTLTLNLTNAGDVIQLVSKKGNRYDFSGSLVQANHPVQVVASIPGILIPQNTSAADHIEESVMPAETLGKRYVVHPPSGPSGPPVPHYVRFYGNKDGTTLTYNPGMPQDCPTALNAGDVYDCGVVDQAFEVTGSQEFAVATFLLGAQAYGDPKGDPSMSTYASIEQFRTKYVFLAPDDYEVNYVDITASDNSGIVLDGTPLAAPPQKVGSGPFNVFHVQLGVGQAGAHTITAEKPVGIQVVGYGTNTSYQYPGGLNLKLIAPPPPPPN